MDDAHVFAMIADERRLLARVLDSLTGEQWDTQSLCGEWTVRHVAAHLAMPFVISSSDMSKAVLRQRLSFTRANVVLAERVRREHGDRLGDILRKHAETRFRPPMNGARAPLTDLVVHGQDIRRPLGMSRAIDPELQRLVLDFLTGGRRPGFGLPRIDVTWTATDLDWHARPGHPEIRGPAEALMLLLTGRSVALDEVTGEGVDVARRALV